MTALVELSLLRADAPSRLTVTYLPIPEVRGDTVDVASALPPAVGRRSSRVGAALCGVAGALSTNLMCLVAFYYFGDAFVLPVVPL